MKMLSTKWTRWGFVLLALVLLYLAPDSNQGHGLVLSIWDDSISYQGPPQWKAVVQKLNVSMDGNLASSNQTIYSERWEGYIDIPASGRWGFSTDSDDGSSLWIDGKKIVENGFRHPRTRREGFISLTQGEHQIKIEYLQTIGESFLKVECMPPREQWQPLDLQWLYPVPKSNFDESEFHSAIKLRWVMLAAAAMLLFIVLAWNIWTYRQYFILIKNSGYRNTWISNLTVSPLFHDVVVIAVCLPFYLQTISVRLPHEPYMKGDSIYLTNIAISVLEDGDLDQKNQTDRRIFENTNPRTNISLANSNISKGIRGEWYPKHSVLMPIVSVPFYALWGGFGLVIFNLFCLLLLVVAARRAASKVATTGAADLAAIATGLTPVFYTFAYSYSPDIFSALLVTAGIWTTMSRKYLLSGLLLGFSLWSKIPNALILSMVGIWLLSQKDYKKTLQFSAGAFVPISLFAGLNWYMFGAPWITAYSRIWVVQNGVHSLGDCTFCFSRPFWNGVWLQVMDPIHGLMQTAPVTILSLGGYLLLYKRNRSICIILALFAVGMFLFYCKYDFTSASHFGNRFLMPVMALSTIPLATLIEAVVIRFTLKTPPKPPSDPLKTRFQNHPDHSRSN